jgi:hypothetical protein
MDREFEYIQASLNTEDIDNNQFLESDPFLKSWDQLKDLSGMDTNFKRRTTRNMAKYSLPLDSYNPRYPAINPTPQYLNDANAFASGKEGAQSKQINPGTVYQNGYGLFDVITPFMN